MVKQKSMQPGNTTEHKTFENARQDTPSYKPDINLTFHPYGSDLFQYTNGSSIFGTNYTDISFEEFWLTNNEHDWREEAVKIFKQPAYVVILILCLFALIVNTVSIMAVRHIRPPRTMHLRLIINLAASDISIVFSVLGHILNKIFNNPFAPGITDPMDRLVNGCVYATLSSINVMTYLISLFNVLTMAVDHYIAIMHPLRYHRIMSKRHGYILIVVLWVTAAFAGFSNFFFGGFGYEEKSVMFNYCEYILFDGYQAEYLMFTATFLCLTSIIYIYLRIYCEVLKIQTNCAVPDDSLHNRKALITTLLIIGTFCLCWLPNCILNIVMIIQLYVNKAIAYDLNTIVIINKYLYILQVTNAFVDPIIYAVRLNVVKSGYRNFLNRLRRKYGWRSSCCLRRSFKSSLVSTSRRPTTTNITQTQNVLPETVFSSKFTSEHSNHSVANGDSQTSNHGYYKISDESDANENELIPMMSMSPEDLQTIINSMNETEL